jgi:hypothetical protein
MPGLENFLAANNYTHLTAEWSGGEEAVLDLFQDGLGRISVWTNQEVTSRMLVSASSS